MNTRNTIHARLSNHLPNNPRRPDFMAVHRTHAKDFARRRVPTFPVLVARLLCAFKDRLQNLARRPVVRARRHRPWHVQRHRGVPSTPLTASHRLRRTRRSIDPPVGIPPAGAPLARSALGCRRLQRPACSASAGQSGRIRRSVRRQRPAVGVGKGFGRVGHHLAPDTEGRGRPFRGHRADALADAVAASGTRRPVAIGSRRSRPPTVSAETERTRLAAQGERGAAHEAGSGRGNLGYA